MLNGVCIHSFFKKKNKTSAMKMHDKDHYSHHITYELRHYYVTLMEIFHYWFDNRNYIKNVIIFLYSRYYFQYTNL